MKVDDVIAPGQDPSGLLAEMAANLRFDDLPEEHVDFVKKDILDMLGCIIAGTTGPTVADVVGQVRE